MTFSPTHRLHLEEAALFNTLTQAVSLGSSAAGGDHLRPLRLLLKAGADANCVDYQVGREAGDS
jgi:hypothetical protein